MQDIRLALRALRSSPAVSLAAVLSLGLAIGATTAIFTVINALLLRPLPVHEPDRLATISSAFAISRGFNAGLGWNYPMWLRLRERTAAFDGALAWSLQRFNLARGGEMDLVDGVYASGDYFRTLGVTARAGRTFAAADDVRGGGPDGPVAVISSRLWERRFARATDVIGRHLFVESIPFTIVGVLPSDFVGLEVGRALDVALPLGTEPLIRGSRSSLDQPRNLFLNVMLRLKPDQPLDAATATLRAMQPDLLGVRPEQMAGVRPAFLREPFTLVPAPTGTSDVSRLRRQYGRPLVTILIVAALVMLIACANVGNLLLARAAGRRHEHSVRLALGAPRWRLAAQLSIEALILGAAAASAGLMFAAWASRTLVALLSAPESPVFVDLPLDWRVLAFTSALAVGTAMLFGTTPALLAARVAPLDALKEQARYASQSHAADGRGYLSGALVVMQIALSIVLVSAAGLFARTFERLASVPLGFDADRVLVLTVNSARARIDPSQRLALYARLVDAVAATPGVAHAAGSTFTPLSTASNAPIFAEPGAVMRNAVTPRWFDAYGIALRAGRGFDERDVAGGQPVAIVNEAYVRQFFSDGIAIGQTADARTIVGVAADVVFGSIRGGTRPTIYVPLAQSAGMGPPDRTHIDISVRPAAGSPAALARSVSSAFLAIDRDLTVASRPLADYAYAALAQERTVAMLAGVFGILALVLAAVGLYGVTSCASSRRRTEIGIRLALGAEPRAVIMLVLARLGILVAVGVIAGVSASLWLSRWVAALLYGVPARDPVTLASAAVVLTAVGALASGLPAFRASRLDPAEVLRQS